MEISLDFIVENIFSVSKEDLTRLGRDQAVDFFSELLWAEAIRIGMRKMLIDVPYNIDAPDGGIDAEIDSSGDIEDSILIKRGNTRYQIKTGPYKLSVEKNIKDLLFNEERTALKDRVKSCFDKKGTLIIVLFGWDDPNQTDDFYVNKIKEQLNSFDRAYADANIQIFPQNKIKNHLAYFPSLSLKINRRNLLIFQTHESWASEAEMRRAFKLGTEQISLISNIQNIIRESTAVLHARIWGDAGIGKTRLILEATKHDDIKPLIIYCAAENFVDSEIMHELLKPDNNFHSILILDECSEENKTYIWNKFKYSDSRIKIITITNEFEASTGDIKYFNIPPLEDEQIIEIFSSHGISPDIAHAYIELCDGSPRMAHVFAENISNEEKDKFQAPDTSNVWSRYLLGGDDPSDVHVQNRITVLRFISLFKKFGFGGSLIEESKQIFGLITKLGVKISWDEFLNSIKKLQKRKILQGAYTLYITPKGLHLKLWLDWWDLNKSTFNYYEFTRDLSPKLISWFAEMFVYARESEATLELTNELLGESGPFKDYELVESEDGSGFFFVLAQANPQAAINYLNKSIGKWSIEKLLAFKGGRRNIVWALERIAVWKESFKDASMILLRLSVAENEDISNNATGVFADLFHTIGATTEVSGTERFEIIRSILNSGSKKEQEISLNACDRALTTGNTMRLIGPEYQGLRYPPKLWLPANWGEVERIFAQYWNLLIKYIIKTKHSLKSKALEILLSHIRSLARYKNMNKIMLDSLDSILELPGINNRLILIRVIGLIKYDSKKLPTDIVENWRQFEKKLTGVDYHSKLIRYVSMDILEDEIDENGYRIDLVIPKLKELAEESLKDIKQFEGELNWLVKSEGRNCFKFGHELSLLDKDHQILKLLIEYQTRNSPDANDFLLGGYLNGVFIKNPDQRDSILESMAENKRIRNYIIGLIWRSGLTDRSGLMVVELIKRGGVDYRLLNTFMYGSVLLPLSNEVFNEWLDYLLSANNYESGIIALNLAHDYYCRKEQRPEAAKNTVMNILLNNNLLIIPDNFDSTMLIFNWSSLAKYFINKYPEYSIKVAEFILQYLGVKNTVFSNWHSEVLNVLYDLTVNYNEIIWNIVTNILDDPHSRSSFYIEQWLEGMGLIDEDKKGSITLFPRELVYNWIDSSVENRVLFIASVIPKCTDSDAWRDSYFREYLIKYFDYEGVDINLYLNLISGGYSGPSSSHYGNLKYSLLQIKNIEDNKAVVIWLHNSIERLEKEIKSAVIDEERRY